MGNTKAGAAKAVETMRQRYGDNFLRQRASKAGRASGKLKNHPTHFKANDARTLKASLKSSKTRQK